MALRMEGIRRKSEELGQTHDVDKLQQVANVRCPHSLAYREEAIERFGDGTIGHQPVTS
jgi:hypothetical protein